MHVPGGCRTFLIMYYILENKTPIPVKDVLEWAKHYEEDSRIVKQDYFPNDIKVSTVFLGLDHGMINGIPLIFETMIFGGKHDEYQERYATWEQAEEGHKKAINLINA